MNKEFIRRCFKGRGYDFCSVTILLLFFILLFRIRSSLPVMQDSWYHLGVVRAFFERGPTLHAWWEFAPFGRPHLYSPLFHLAGVAILHVTGLNLVDLARLYDVVTFPLVLLAGWLTARLLFGMRAAFVTLLLLSLNIALLFPCSLIMMPGTYAMLLWPLVHVLVLRKKVAWAVFLLSVTCYLHFGIAGVAAFSLFLLALFRRDYWKTVLLVVVSTCVVFSPWLVHLYRHREFLHSGVSHVPVFIPVFTVLAAVLGIVSVIKRPEKESLAVLSTIIASAFFFFTLRDRFWIYGGFSFALLGGYGIERCAKEQIRWVILILFISCASVTPFLKPSQTKVGLPLPFQGVPWLMATPGLTLAEWQKADKAAEIPPAVPDDIAALAHWIKGNVEMDDILLANDPQLGGYLFALTGRRTTSGLWSEVYTDELKEKLAGYLRTGKGYFILRGDDAEAARLLGTATSVTAFGRFGVFYRPS